MEAARARRACPKARSLRCPWPEPRPSTSQHSTTRSAVLAGLCRLATPGLVLAAPLVNYAVFLGYPLVSLDFLIVFGAVMLAGVPVALVVWLRPSLLVSIVYPFLILLAIDLNFGVDALRTAAAGTQENIGLIFSMGMTPPFIAAFVLLSLIIRLAGDNAQPILFAIFAVMIATTPLVGERLVLPSSTIADARFLHA